MKQLGTPLARELGARGKGGDIESFPPRLQRRDMPAVVGV